MSKFDLSDKVRGDVVLHSTPGVAKFQQSTLWDSYGRRFQFVPTQAFGMVIATFTGWRLPYKITIGWILWRPHSLVLSWLLDKRVDMVGIDLESAVACYYENTRPWVIVGKATREFPEHVIPR